MRQEHLGGNLRSLILSGSIENENEYGSVRTADVLVRGGGNEGRFGVLSSKVMVAKQGAQLLSNTLRIVEMRPTGEEFDLLPAMENYFGGEGAAGEAAAGAEGQQPKKVSQLETKLRCAFLLRACCLLAPVRGCSEGCCMDHSVLALLVSLGVCGQGCGGAYAEHAGGPLRRPPRQKLLTADR